MYFILLCIGDSLLILHNHWSINWKLDWCLNFVLSVVYIVYMYLSIQYTLCTVHCTLHNLQLTFYTHTCTLYTIIITLYMYLYVNEHMFKYHTPPTIPWKCKILPSIGLELHLIGLQFLCLFKKEVNTCTCNCSKRYFTKQLTAVLLNCPYTYNILDKQWIYHTLN